MRARRGIEVLTVVVLAMAGCDEGSSESTADDAGVTATTEESTPSDSSAGTAGAPTSVDGPSTTAPGPATTGTAPASPERSVSWMLEASLTGDLEQIVSWSDGFTAIMDIDGDELPAGGELWSSNNGVDWASATPGPSGRADFYELAGVHDQVFAISGDIFDDATPQTLWRQRSGGRWEEVLTDEALEHIAVNADRLIAYALGNFEVVGVFDTETMEPVEFAGLPDVAIEPTEQVAALEDFLGSLVYQGRVTALDDGFLAEVGWLVSIAPDAVDWRLLYSADGTTWIEHPSPPTGERGRSPGGAGLALGRPAAPEFDGLNLIASTSTSPTEPGSAWVTDDGVDFEPVPVPDDSPPLGVDPAFVVEHTTGTDSGFFTVVGGTIHQSLDGSAWATVDAPVTWSEPADFDSPGFAGGSVLTTDDALVAVGVHGQLEGFVGLTDPTTDIWVAGR